MIISYIWPWPLTLRMYCPSTVKPIMKLDFDLDLKMCKMEQTTKIDTLTLHGPVSLFDLWPWPTFINWIITIEEHLAQLLLLPESDLAWHWFVNLGDIDLWPLTCSQNTYNSGAFCTAPLIFCLSVQFSSKTSSSFPLKSEAASESSSNNCRVSPCPLSSPWWEDSHHWLTSIHWKQ